MLEATLGTEHPIATVRAQLLSEVRRIEAFPAMATIPTSTLGTPFQWLKAQPQCPRIIWSNRGDDQVIENGGADVQNLVSPTVQLDNAVISFECSTRNNRLVINAQGSRR